jgi:hypothetical protein
MKMPFSFAFFPQKTHKNFFGCYRLLPGTINDGRNRITGFILKRGLRGRLD